MAWARVRVEHIRSAIQFVTQPREQITGHRATGRYLGRMTNRTNEKFYSEQPAHKKTTTVYVEYELAYDAENNQVWARDGLKNVVVWDEQHTATQTTLAEQAKAFYKECQTVDGFTWKGLEFVKTRPNRYENLETKLCVFEGDKQNYWVEHPDYSGEDPEETPQEALESFLADVTVHTQAMHTLLSILVAKHKSSIKSTL